MRRALLVITLAALAGVFTAAAVHAARGAESPAGAATRATIVVRSSSFGRILFDGRGLALYAFTKDPRGRSVCSGACARAWPPFIVSGKPRAGPGALSPLIGTARRADGRLQATYKGRPLYSYVGDTGPGIVRCQNVVEFGGTWLVERASGALVR